MRFFDTHAHIYDSRYEENGIGIQDILMRCKESGVDRILIPGDSKVSSEEAVKLANTYDGISGVALYASVGIHPHEAKTYDSKTEEYLR